MNDTIYFAIHNSRQIKVSAGMLADVVLEKEQDAFEALADMLKNAPDHSSLYRVPRGGTHKKSRLYAIPASALCAGFDASKLRAASVAMH